MADQPEAGSVQALLEELTREMTTSAGPDLDAAARQDDALAKALAEAATVSLSRALAESSEFDRLLLADALAPALADALAPALARALLPEIVNVLGQPSLAKPAVQEPVGGSPTDGKG